MPWRSWLVVVCLMPLATSGCVSMREQTDSEGLLQSPPQKEDRPKTLLKWIAGRPDDAEEDKDEPNSNGGKNGDEAEKDAKAKPKEPEKDEIVTDRPDFTEASSTVGRGRIQLKSG